MIVIIGGGLAGLSTALALARETGGRSEAASEFLVLEGEPDAGGLCRSRQVGDFVFDFTGHLLHLRDPEVIGLVDRLLPGAFAQVERKAAIHSHGVLLPYPFQANTHGLPREAVFECVFGLHRALQTATAAQAGDLSFHEWSLATFGEGISKHFMLPYNRKMWLRDLNDVTADWVSWAVPRPTMEEVLKGALGLTQTGLGYNPTFRYPKSGGIGVLPRAFADELARVRPGAIRYGTRAAAVDAKKKTVTTSAGETIPYDALVTTAALPQFIAAASNLSPRAMDLAYSLAWVDVYCLNLGIDREHVVDQHWIYFPEPEFPFYRVGAPSEFSDTVAPKGASSLYVEVTANRGEVVDEVALVASIKQGLARAGILRDGDRILAEELIRLSPAYVIFDRARQRAMGPLLEELAARDIHAIGRFGAWTYSYMEAAIKDGLRTARALKGLPEGPAAVLPPSAGKD